MRSNLLYLAMLGLSLAACNNKTNTDGSTVTSTDSVSHMADTTSTKMTESKSGDMSKTMKEDSNFLATAHQIGTFEIEAAKLAQTKSQNAKIKEFADMMIADHTAMGKDVEGLAKQKSIMLPAGMGEDNQKEYDKLNGMSGAKFDKEYVDVNVKGHKDAISKFEKASKNDDCSAEAKQLANTALPKLNAHKEHAEMTQKGMKM